MLIRRYFPFENSNVEIGDSLQAAVSVTNNSDYALTGLRLTVDAPEFIELGKGEGIDLDTLAAWSALHRSRLLLHVLPRGQVGNVNLRRVKRGAYILNPQNCLSLRYWRKEQ